MFADDPQNTDREEERTEEPKKSDPPERGGNQKQKEEVPQWGWNTSSRIASASCKRYILSILYIDKISVSNIHEGFYHKTS